MNEATLSKIIAELRDNLVGRKFGKIFALGREQFAVDFQPHEGFYLLISASPADSRIHLIRRKLGQLTSDDRNPGNFLSVLRKRLTHALLQEISKPEGERVVYFSFESRDEAGLDHKYCLTLQLTGRSSNVFLLDSDLSIIDAIRSTHGAGQEIGDAYGPPERKAGSPVLSQESFQRGEFPSLSEALDNHFLLKQTEQAFRTISEKARASVAAELKKQTRLKKKLESDLAKHGDPEEWKRLADLLNANIATATRDGDTITVIDYFDEGLGEIKFDLDENVSIREAAENFYRKYAKSKSAETEIGKRLSVAQTSIEELGSRMREIESAIASRDTHYLVSLVPEKKVKDKKRKGRSSDVSKYAREFTSSDGLTILVGKKSKDNDYLTFRIARSLDTWLHAADYPGSHVVIRKKGGEEVPHKTLLEAARLAAFYSKAKNESKAAVSYTQRKFVSKPKGAAPGLVSLSSSKTIMVEPGVPNFD